MKLGRSDLFHSSIVTYNQVHSTYHKENQLSNTYFGLLLSCMYFSYLSNILVIRYRYKITSTFIILRRKEEWRPLVLCNFDWETQVLN